MSYDFWTYSPTCAKCGCTPDERSVRHSVAIEHSKGWHSSSWGDLCPSCWVIFGYGLPYANLRNQ